MINEMKTGIFQEIDGRMFSKNTQKQRTIDNAINSQLIPQIKYSLRAVNGEQPCDRPDVEARRS